MTVVVPFVLTGHIVGTGRHVERNADGDLLAVNPDHVKVWCCTRCGGAVVDCDAHEGWHRLA